MSFSIRTRSNRLLNYYGQTAAVFFVGDHPALVKRKDEGGSKSEIVDAAATALKLGSVTSNIEEDAGKADAPFTMAKERLAKAVAALKDLEDKWKASVKDDATIRPLITASDSVKSSLDAATLKYQQDLAVGNTNTSRVTGNGVRRVGGG